MNSIASDGDKCYQEYETVLWQWRGWDIWKAARKVLSEVTFELRPEWKKEPVLEIAEKSPGSRKYKCLIIWSKEGQDGEHKK